MIRRVEAMHLLLSVAAIEVVHPIARGCLRVRVPLVSRWREVSQLALVREGWT
jgi:hypothetical protein